MAIYMKITGFEGHVSMQGYEKWIELNSVDFTIQRSFSTTPGNIAERESTRPFLSDITLSKEIDKTTPDLFSAACGVRQGGKAIDTIEIHFCQTSGASVKAYLEYKLSNILISHYALHADNKCENMRPQEILGLNYVKIETKYTTHDAQHGSGSPILAGYDLKSGSKL